MLKSKRFLLLPLIIIMSVLLAHAVFAAETRVFYNGSEIFYDVPPQMVHGRTMVPVRTTIETITGSAMEWNASTKTVTFRANGHTNVHTIGQKVVYVDGKAVNFDTPSMIINSRTLVPIRMIAETSGSSVDWDSVNKYVIITKQQQSSPQPTSSPASISSVAADKTTITKGESIDITIMTNSAAKYVWVEYDNTYTNASYRNTSKNIKTWVATITPNETQRVRVYAHASSRTTSGAESQTQSITVNEVSYASITSATANKTTVTEGDAVTLTVRTNTAATSAWVDTGYETETMTLSAQNSASKTWTLTFYPYESGRVYIYTGRSSRAQDDNTSINITVKPRDENPQIKSAPSDSDEDL